MTSKTENQGVTLCCPSCQTRLEKLPGALKCAGCAREFPTSDGILCLAQRWDASSEEIGASKMRDLLEDCEHSPWQQALERMAHKSSQPFTRVEYIVSPCRASWWPLLNLQPHWRVLDFGCGWGAITFSLAPQVASVVACDLNLGRLRFMKARAQQDGVANVEILCAGDTARLPFADESFDLVILNGVLALLPTTLAGHPQAIQRTLLQEAFRLLAPGGQLLLAEQNRWSLRHWLGKPEDHSQLPFISLLPRAAADFYSRLRSRQPYRTPSYSFWGYKRLLREAGFGPARAYVPLPDFRSFQALVEPSEKPAVERYFAEREASRFEALELKARSSLTTLLATSFCWIADRGEAQESFLESLGRHLAGTLYGEPGSRITCTKFKVSPRETIACELEIKPGSSKILVKLPLSEAAHGRAKSDFATLQSIHELLGSSGHWPEIPKPLLAGEFRKVPYFAQQALSGLSGLRFLHAARRTGRWRQPAFDFLVRLHSATRSDVKLDETAWNQWVLPVLDPGLQSIEQRIGIHAGLIRERLMRDVLGQSLPLVFSHGDYWPGNFLFDPRSQQLRGVVDWDCARPHSLPLIDLLNLILSVRIEADAGWATEVVAKLLLDGLDPDDARLVDAYLDRMGFSLSPHQLRAYLLLTWLQRISLQVLPGHTSWWYEHQWVEQNVDPAWPWLTQLLRLTAP
ncbi:MAG: methyltransferase domain-containing protein [Acidobacteria bacterium]|nr:methyltransferase domain-containing protein [Acidobacteriota bacterium]